MEEAHYPDVAESDVVEAAARYLHEGEALWWTMCGYGPEPTWEQIPEVRRTALRKAAEETLKRCQVTDFPTMWGPKRGPFLVEAINLIDRIARIWARPEGLHGEFPSAASPGA